MKINKSHSESIYQQAKYTSSKDNTCGSCWGSGWAIQFQLACPKCKGTGKVQ